MVPWKGELAYDYLTVQCLEPDVLGFSKRTSSIDWYDGDTWQVHKPRYKVFRSGPQEGVRLITEVDVLWSWELERARRKFDRVARQALTRHIDYLILTEKQIRVSPRYRNAMIVQSQAGSNLVSNSNALRLQEFVRSRDKFTLNQVVEANVMPYLDAYTAILNRVANGEFLIDIGVAFDGDSLVVRKVH